MASAPSISPRSPLTRTASPSRTTALAIHGQQKLPPLPTAMGSPEAGTGGVVVPLFPPNSPYLKAGKIREPEQYNMSQEAPGPHFEQ